MLDQWLIYYKLLSERVHKAIVLQNKKNENHKDVADHVGDFPMKMGVKHGYREIVMRSKQRYEISILSTMTGQYNDAADLTVREEQPSLEDLKESLSHICFALMQVSSWNELQLCNVTFITSRPGSVDQSWHADGGHLSLSEHLPCHCMNIFLPLVDVTQEMGPTELRPQSHYLTRNLAPMMLAARCRKTLQTPVAPLLRRGDALCFDYRILHRGLRNSQPCTDRVFLVVTVSRPFFRDILNFPSRSVFQ